MASPRGLKPLQKRHKENCETLLRRIEEAIRIPGLGASALNSLTRAQSELGRELRALAKRDEAPEEKYQRVLGEVLDLPAPQREAVQKELNERLGGPREGLLAQ